MASQRGRRRAPAGRHRPRRRRQRLARRRRARALAGPPRAGRQRRPDPLPHALRAAGAGAGARRWITFDGIFYQADVWLDGAYLGDPEGYFFPHSFDITALCRLGDDHVLAVEVTCNPERGTRGRRNITGLFQHSEAVDRALEPGWAVATGARRTTPVPVKLDRLRVLCRDADDTRAHLRLPARLDSDSARTVRLRTTADGVVVGEAEHPLAAGTNEIEWSLDIDRPRLWWPRALGEQPLTEIGVERARRRRGQRPTCRGDRAARGGLERLDLLDQRRAPVPQGRQRPADPTRASPTPRPRRSAATCELAVEAGLDALRVQAHIADHELYRAADELGVLLLQDFPLQWGYARQIRREAVRQAREAVNVLGHHPSIVQWCAHDEPVADAPQVEAAGRAAGSAGSCRQQLPTWNKSILDRWLKRAFEQADPTRPTVAHGGVVPAPAHSSTAPTPTCGSAGTVARSPSWPRSPT